MDWDWIYLKDPNDEYDKYGYVPHSVMQNLLNGEPLEGYEDLQGLKLELVTFPSETAAQQAVLDTIIHMSGHLQAIKTAEISHYRPSFPERQVLSYRDFK